jgi:hypothetical protein
MNLIFGTMRNNGVSTSVWGCQRVAPAVMLGWDTGCRPIEGLMRLLPGDFSTIGPRDRRKRLRIGELPSHDTPWNGSISLRREDVYGDDGR